MNVRNETKKYLHAQLTTDGAMPTDKKSSEEVAGICARKWSLKDLSLEGETPQSHFYSCNTEQHGCNDAYRTGRVNEMACIAHVRREFFDLYESAKLPVAGEAVLRIKKLYDVETHSPK